MRRVLGRIVWLHNLFIPSIKCIPALPLRISFLAMQSNSHKQRHSNFNVGVVWNSKVTAQSLTFCCMVVSWIHESIEYVYVCLCVNVWVSACHHVRVWVESCFIRCIRACICVRALRTCVCVCVYACKYVCMYVQYVGLCIYVYMYICIYTYIWPVWFMLALGPVQPPVRFVPLPRLAAQRNARQDRLAVEISRSHMMTHHSRLDSFGRVIGPS